MPNSRDYAIVAGVAEYGALPKRKLKGPPNDVAHIADWLVDPLGGDVPAANVKMLWANPPPLPPGNGYPTPADQPKFDSIYLTLFNLIEDLEAADTRGRRIYVFLAGHGESVARARTDAVMLAKDWTQKLQGRGISGAALLDYIRYKQAFEEVILIMDCCRNENVALLAPSGPPWGAIDAYPFPEPNWMFVRAARPKEPAYEEPFPTPTSPNVFGILTRAALDALLHYRPNGDLTAQAFRNYVYNRVEQIAESRKRIQRADIEICPGADNMSIVSGNNAEADVRVEFSNGPQAARQIEVGIDTITLRTIPADGALLAIKLPIGHKYWLRVVGDPKRRIVNLLDPGGQDERF